MLFFVFTTNQDDKKGYEFINAYTYDELFKILDRSGVYALKIVEIPTFFQSRIFSLESKVSIEDIVEILQNLHLILKTGVPIYQGILDLASDSDNRKIKKMLFGIADTINRGESLYEAFKPYKDLLGAMVLNLIKVGEETGELSMTVKRGALFLSRINSLQKKVKSALIYPAFAIATVLGMMSVWMLYVLPQMIELFKYMDIGLPPLTVFIISVSDFFSKYIIYIAVFFIALGAIFKVLHKNSKKVRRYTDKLILKVPVVKSIVIYFNTAFISEYIKLALISGVPIVNAINSLDKNIENELFQEALQEIKNDVVKGTQLSEAFLNTKMFPPFTIRMMSIGETTGNLDSQLDLIANNYYEKVDYYAENIAKIIEPLVLILIGGFMAIIMASLIGPMYDLVSKVK